MILQALKGYYDRLADAGTEGLPKLGFSRQKIHFCLCLDRRGNPAGDGVLDLRDASGRKPVPVDMIVPEPAKRSGTGYAPSFLWDNTGYVLGADGKGKPERVAEAFAAFKALHKTIAEGVDDEGLEAVGRFLESWSPADAPGLRYWDEMAGMNVVFRLEGDRCYVHERPKARGAWLRYRAGRTGGERGMCLVTGEEGPVGRVHAAIKGVAGAQSSGAALISFNLDAFKSYGKDQNYNAPVGESAVFAYTTGLNWLLRNGSRQRLGIGDATVVFWAERGSAAENLLAMLLGGAAAEEDGGGDNPEAAEDLRIILEAARCGRIQDVVKEPDAPFYILGLSPNASRLSARFCHMGSVGEVLANVAAHLRDMEIVKSFPNDPSYPSVRRLLRETAPQGKRENESPLLAGAFARSVLTGAPYPANLLPSILMRIRADLTINYPRAALIKACLVRNHSHKEITVSLDKENTNTGYRLGRLFAVLERIQKEAVPGINSTIRDKYYGSAAATPRNIFPMLISLGLQHLGKLRRDGEKRGFAGSYDLKIEEILAPLPGSSFPAFLDPENQGLFALGYYHQRQDLYTAKSDKKPQSMDGSHTSDRKEEE